MVVIAGEVGGRWSEETKAFLWSLACEKSRFEAEGPPKERQGCFGTAGGVASFACAAAKAVAFVAPGASRSPGGWG